LPLHINKQINSYYTTASEGRPQVSKAQSNGDLYLTSKVNGFGTLEDELFWKNKGISTQSLQVMERREKPGYRDLYNFDTHQKDAQTNSTSTFSFLSSCNGGSYNGCSIQGKQQPSHQ
jgi:hypothetical protein